jgi:hypothetical protein
LLCVCGQNLELKTSDTVLDNALFGFVKKQVCFCLCGMHVLSYFIY